MATVLLVLMAAAANAELSEQRAAIEAEVQSLSDPYAVYDVLIGAAEDFMYEDDALAFEYARRARQTARDIGFTEGEVRAMARMAGVSWRLNQGGKATRLVDEAVAIAERNQAPDNRFYAYWYQADLNHKMGRYEAAIDGYAEVVEIIPATTLQEHLKPLNVAIAYANMGEIYLETGQPLKSLEYSKAAVSESEDYSHAPHRIILLIQLIKAYMANADYAQAIAQSERALEIAADNDLAISSHYPRLLMSEAYLRAYEAEGNPERLDSARQAFAGVAQTAISGEHIQDYYLVQAEISLESARLDAAEAAIGESLALPQDQSTALNRAESYQLLAEIYEQRAEPDRALAYLKQAYALERNLYRDRVGQAVARLQIYHDSQKKDADLMQERLKNEAMAKEMAFNNLLLIGLVVVTVLVLALLLILYLLYKNKTEANRQLDELARVDELTKLLNRRAMNDVIAYETIRHQRSEAALSFILCDIDRFKSFNDRWGHRCGDQILKMVAKCLCGAVRAQDKVARWGGEEFLLLLPETTLDSAALVAAKLQAHLASQRLDWQGEHLSVTLSYGIAQYDRELGAEESISRADKALYEAKAAGRDAIRTSRGRLGKDESGRLSGYSPALK